MQELLVGLVISSIIIGMTYTIYVQINRQLIEHNRNLNELMEFNQFRQILSKDFILSKTIEQVNENEFKLVFSDGAYTYKKNEKLMLRERFNGLKDTFNIAITKMEFIDDNVEDKGIGKVLKISTQLLGEDIMLFESKMIANDTKINDLYLNEY